MLMKVLSFNVNCVNTVGTWVVQWSWFRLASHWVLFSFIYNRTKEKSNRPFPSCPIKAFVSKRGYKCEAFDRIKKNWDIFLLLFYLHKTSQINILSKIWQRLFFPTLYKNLKIKPNPFLKWPRDFDYREWNELATANNLLKTGFHAYDRPDRPSCLE